MSSSTRQEPNPKKRRAGDPQSLLSTNDDCGAALDQTMLAGAKAFILKGLSKHNKEFWDDLPSEWKKDRDVAIEALAGGKTTMGDLPVELRDDRDFAIAAANRNLAVWRSLPPILKDDIAFARSITIYTDLNILDDIFEKFPILANERNTWLAILSVDQHKYALHELWDTIADYAPQVILSDRELMMRACMLDSSILYSYVNDSLSRNGDFLREILTMDPEALWHIPVESQAMFPELLVEFLPNALHTIAEDRTVSYQSSLARQMIPELWQNRAFVRAWFQGGGPFLDSGPMESLKGDREVFLWVAANFPKDDPSGLVRSFEYASPALRSDKGFMLQAIEHNPNIYHACPDQLLADFDVFLTAFGGTAGKYPAITEESWMRLRGVIRQCGLRVEEELVKQETFVKTLLCGISLHHPNTTPTTALALLNQGEATALSYKRLIAEYLDVPTGKRLQMLRQASRNLACALSSLALVLQVSS